MNKKVISIMIVTLFLLTCLSTTVSSNKIIATPVQTNLDINIPTDENSYLKDYIEDIKKTEPEDIVEIVEEIEDNVILEEDGEISVDIYELAKAIEKYDYDGLALTGEVSVIDTLFDLIISSIEGRLGWVYVTIDKVTTIIQEAQAIISLAQYTVNTAKDLYNIGKDVLNTTMCLLKGNFKNFTDNWELGYYITNIQLIIGDLQILANNIPQLYNLIMQTISDSTEFIDYISSNPWEDDIKIYGNTFELNGPELTGIEGVVLSCRGISDTSDSNGEFDFFVSIDDTSDSIPPNLYYGMHNCIVTAERNEEIKTSKIPYVFGGGKIYKDFYFKAVDDDSKAKKINIFYRFGWLQEFFSSFLKIFYF